MENADTLTTQEIVVYIFIHAFLFLLGLYFIELSDDLKCLVFFNVKPVDQAFMDFSGGRGSEDACLVLSGSRRCLI